MIHENEWSKAKTSLLHSHNIDCVDYGHVSRSALTKSEIVTIEERYPLLSTEEFSLVDGNGKVKLETLDPFYGLGVTAIFINDKFYILPRHYMSALGIRDYIMEVLTQHYPDLLI